MNSKIVAKALLIILVPLAIIAVVWFCGLVGVFMLFANDSPGQADKSGISSLIYGITGFIVVPSLPLFASLWFYKRKTKINFDKPKKYRNYFLSIFCSIVFAATLIYFIRIF